MLKLTLTYEDLLNDRRNELSHFIWSSKKVNAVKAFKQKNRPTPGSHKDAVLQNPKILEVVAQLSQEHKISKEQLILQIKDILDEIGYNKNLKVIRWLGLILVKICLRTCNGIYINKDSIFHCNSLMGNCPVVFLPSHRSYADFILMSLVCFTYDVEIPAIAAGMDFHGMWGMGSILRDTGAFFMRRTYNDDSLYWTTFKQYIYQIVTKGDLPIEFFIEGTRSRSNKSLMPKYGLLNMVLKPLFLRQVPDILFVPLNISYERILEEKLFAFELLGIPKPKETTKGFFKSLSIIKENFGSIFISVGKPISAKTFFGEKLNDSKHHLGPIYRQELTEDDKKIIPPLAHKIIHCQQKLCVLNPVNLIAIILNYQMSNFKHLITITELYEKIKILQEFLEEHRAQINIKDLNTDVLQTFRTHKDLFQITNNKIDLKWENINLDNANVAKFKAMKIPNSVMSYSLPFIKLYLYINPTMYHLVDSALIVTILKDKTGLDLDSILNSFLYLRKLLINEFVHYDAKLMENFGHSLETSLKLKLISMKANGKYQLQENYITNLLLSSLQPFLYSYFTILNILKHLEKPCKEKIIFFKVQKKITLDMKKTFVHPYCLNLDTMANCLSSLVNLNCIEREKRNGVIFYLINNKQILLETERTLGEYIKIVKNSEALNINFWGNL